MDIYVRSNIQLKYLVYHLQILLWVWRRKLRYSEAKPRSIWNFDLMWNKSCRTENITHFCNFFLFFKQVSFGCFNSNSISVKFLWLNKDVSTHFWGFYFENLVDFGKKDFKYGIFGPRILSEMFLLVQKSHIWGIFPQNLQDFKNKIPKMRIFWLRIIFKWVS